MYIAINTTSVVYGPGGTAASAGTVSTVIGTLSDPHKKPIGTTQFT